MRMHIYSPEWIIRLTVEVCIGAFGYVIGMIGFGFTEFHEVSMKVIGLLIMLGACVSIWHGVYVSWKNNRNNGKDDDDDYARG